MKCLFIGIGDVDDLMTGGAVSISRIYNVIQYCFGKNNVDYITPLTKREEAEICANKMKKNLIHFFWAIQGVFVGLTYEKREKIINIIRAEKYDCVVLSSSLLGKILLDIKKNNLPVKVITFFQNIEYKYFNDYANASGKSKLLLAYAAKYNEKIIAKYSDVLVVLNERDKELLKLHYDVVSKNIFDLPISLHDKFKEDKVCRDINGYKLKLITVGSDFFPTYHGTKWFVDNVMPFVNAELYILGKGMEKYKNEFESSSVHVVGTVDSLDDWYYDADIVVEPIFYGGGMKTKTAEAMMFGKYILGTKEALVGYEVSGIKEIKELNTKEEYISEINSVNGIKKYNKDVRNAYLNNYEIKKSAENFYLKIKQGGIIDRR